MYLVFRILLTNQLCEMDTYVSNLSIVHILLSGRSGIPSIIFSQSPIVFVKMRFSDWMTILVGTRRRRRDKELSATTMKH